jgi:sodium/hydrogen antiporter
VYEKCAVLALFVFGYSILAARIERSYVSGPMVCMICGAILGPNSLGLLKLNLVADDLRLLGEGALAMILFTDAAKADVMILRRIVFLPERLLLIGLPLTVLLGFAFGWLLFPSVSPIELGLLAAILAPTDAALGKSVIVNPETPKNIREALNVESGLNDGICVPIVVILLSFAIEAELKHDPVVYATLVVLEEVGIGLVVGTFLAIAAVGAIRWIGSSSISRTWNNVATPALAIACFTLAQALGGSGFIASFVSGLLFGALQSKQYDEPLQGAESLGEALSLITWLAFGSIVVSQLYNYVRPSFFLYAAISLTVARMLPVFLCLLGTSISLIEALFIGWFGPRGLASIVLAIITFDANLPDNTVLMATVAWTVVISVVAHGMTANLSSRIFRVTG